MFLTKYTITCDTGRRPDGTWCGSEITAGPFKSSVRKKALGLGWGRRRGLFDATWYCPVCRGVTTDEAGDKPKVASGDALLGSPEVAAMHEAGGGYPLSMLSRLTVSQAHGLLVSYLHHHSTEFLGRVQRDTNLPDEVVRRAARRLGVEHVVAGEPTTDDKAVVR